MAITEVFSNFDLATGSDDGSSEANAYQTWSSQEAGRVVGERVNCKKTSSPFQPGAAISFALSATDLLVSRFRGYGSTIGDGVKFEFDMEGNRLSIPAESALFQTFTATGTETSRMIDVTGDMSRLDDFSAINTATSSNTHNAVTLNDSHATNGYIENNTTGTGSTKNAVKLNRGYMDSVIVVATNVGVEVAVAFKANGINHCLFYEKGSSAAIGISLIGYASGGSCLISNCTVDGYVDAIDFGTMDDVAGAVEPVTIFRTLLSNATIGIANGDTATKNMTAITRDIAFFNCGTDSQLGDNEIINKISLSVSPYTDASNDIYTLNNTAGGGADCRAAAAFGGGIGSNDNFVDIGAMQHEDAGGGGGGISTLIGEGGLIG